MSLNCIHCIHHVYAEMLLSTAPYHGAFRLCHGACFLHITNKVTVTLVLLASTMQSYFQHLQCNTSRRSFTCKWTGHTYTVQSAVASHVRSEQNASACYSDQCHKHAQSVDLQQVYLVVYCDVIFSKMKHAMSTSQGYYTLFPCFNFTFCSTSCHVS